MPQRKKRTLQASSGPDSAELARRREECLRPWPTLGYDHDELGSYMLSCAVLDLAESEFRRAVWLNPYEPRFKWHLAWCLYRRKRFVEAREWMEQVPVDGLSDTEREMRRWIAEGAT